MKRIFLIPCLFIASICLGQHEHKNANASADTLKKSIPKEVHEQIGDAHLMIKYHSPAVRGRAIWGGLVQYGEVWVTGAHSATAWEFNKDLMLNGKVIPAGKYAIFTIPGKEKWIVIINKKWEQHLADDYDAKDDVARIEVVPQNLTSIQERLLYSITKISDKSGQLSISWEKIKVTVPFQVK